MKPKWYISALPLFFFILWESGAIHSGLGLITPLYVVKIVSALCLSSFALTTDMSKFFKTFLAILLFFLPFFTLSTTPNLFLILTLTYIISKSTAIFKATMTLSPLAITETLGLALPMWLTILTTFLLIIFGSKIKSAPKINKKPFPFYALYALTSTFLIFLLVSFSSFDPFASPKNNIVAYDGYHSSLKSIYFKNETTIHSTLRYLNSIGYTSLIVNEAISTNTLKGISVFIIDTPNKNFSSTEIGHLMKFVEEGGGLFILGDHTNVLNCYMTLNPLLNRFGTKLNFDYSMLWEPHFSSLAGLNSFEGTAGGTLSLRTWEGIIFYSLKYTTWADLGDWNASDQAYIGNLAPEENEEYGVLPICAAINYGNGRVVVISNSDSMNGLFIPYNHKFLAKTIDYLNYKNSFIRTSYFRTFLFLFILLGIIKLRLSFITIFLISLSITLLILQIHAVLPIRSLPTENLIALDVGHGNVEGYGPPHLYKNIFFVVFAQHYGFNPVLVENIPENLEIYKAYVTMGPTLPFSAEEAQKIKEFVENGGVLIVFDGYHADTPTKTSNDAGNSLLKTFNMSLSGQLLGETSYSGNTTWNYETAYRIETRVEAKPASSELMNDVNGSITMYSATQVQGGTPIAAYKDKPVISIKNIEKGYVLVIGDHTIFRNIAEYEPAFRYIDLNLKQFIENIFTLLGGKEQFGV